MAGLAIGAGPQARDRIPMRTVVPLFFLAFIPLLFVGLMSQNTASLAPPGLPVESPSVPAILHAARGQGHPSFAASPRPASEALRRQFERTSNYAAFIHDAMQRPSEGGRFYAYLANARCTEFASWRRTASREIKGDRALYDKAVQAIEALERRCSGVDSSFGSQLGFARSFLYACDKSPDALMARPGPRPAGDAGSIDAELARARQAGDPYLLATLIETNAGALGKRIDPAFGDPARHEILYLAAGAAACQIVGDCSDNLQLQMQCFAGGECDFADRRDALRAQVPEQSKALFDRAVQALLQIARY